MRITATSADAPPSHPVAWGVPVATGDDGPRYAVPLDGFDLGLPARLDPAWCKRRDFGGKVGQTLTLRSAAPAPAAPTEGGASAPAGPVSTTEIVLVGVGDPGSFEGDRGLESLRRASASFVGAAGSGESAVLLLAPVPDLPVGSSAEAAALGAELAAYRYDDFRTADSPERLEALVLAVGSPSDVDGADGGATRGARIAESVSLARDLVNEPPSSLTPQKFAETFAARCADVSGLSVEVWDEGRIADEHLGGLLGVSRGSTQPPRLVRVEYEPQDPLVVDGRVPHLVLVGKGITFDSGGLSLKPAGGMETMKTDMGGAAAVLGAVDAAAAPAARRLLRPHRVRDRRYAQRRAPRTGRKHLGGPAAGRVRGRGPLGPPRHRRARPLGREHPLPGQGRDRLRSAHPGGVGDLRGVRALSRAVGPVLGRRWQAPAGGLGNRVSPGAPGARPEGALFCLL